MVEIAAVLALPEGDAKTVLQEPTLHGSQGAKQGPFLRGGQRNNVA